MLGLSLWLSSQITVGNASVGVEFLTHESTSVHGCHARNIMNWRHQLKIISDLTDLPVINVIFCRWDPIMSPRECGQRRVVPPIRFPNLPGNVVRLNCPENNVVNSTGTLQKNCDSDSLTNLSIF